MKNIKEAKAIAKGSNILFGNQYGVVLDIKNNKATIRLRDRDQTKKEVDVKDLINIDESKNNENKIMKKIELEKMVETIVRKKLSEVKKTKKVNEAIEDIKLPSSVQSFMNKVKTQIEKVNLNKNQQMSAILQLVNALGIDKQQFNSYISRIKTEVPE